MKTTNNSNINSKNNRIYSLSLLRNSLFLVLFFYFSIGIFLGITHILGKRPRRQDIFPIYTWFLFHKVRQEQRTTYNIIIHQHNEKIFNPGIPFEKADYSIITANNVTVYTLINKMGNAYQRNKHEELTKLRKIFEGNFLKGQIKYELVQEKYSLLKKYKTGEVKQTSLEFFHKYEHN